MNDIIDTTFSDIAAEMRDSAELSAESATFRNSENDGNPQHHTVSAESALSAGVELAEASILSLDDGYPIESLGRLMAEAARDIARAAQVPFSVAAQSVLAAASMVAQKEYDVVIDGRYSPLSLFAITILGSGGRKSTSDKIATRPLHEYQRERFKEWQELVVEAGENKPPIPILFSQEPTLEGLHKSLADGIPAQGLLSDEGGQFFGGHAMSPDTIQKTISGLSKLWDGDPVYRLRGGKGESAILFDRRLTVHLLLQPVIADQILESRLMMEQGILARFLICHPESLAGDRLYDQYNIYDESDALKKFHAFITNKLPKRFLVNETGGCDLGVIKPNGEAQREYIRFYNGVERSIKGKNATVEAVASKTAENALRLAGIIAYTNERTVIDLHTMRAGTTLAQFYLDQQRRLTRRSLASDNQRLSLDLWDTLKTKKDKNGIPLYWNQIVEIELLQKRLPPKLRASVQLIRTLMAMLERTSTELGVFCAELNQKHEPKAWFVGKKTRYDEAFAELNPAETAENAENQQ